MKSCKEMVWVWFWTAIQANVQWVGSQWLTVVWHQDLKASSLRQPPFRSTLHQRKQKEKIKPNLQVTARHCKQNP